MKSSTLRLTLRVLTKEIVGSLRFKTAWAAMLMFCLTTLAAVGLSLQGTLLSPEIAAPLLWVIIFFGSMAGTDRIFAEEAASGTLPALLIYGDAAPILWGKFLFTLLMLLILTLFIVPLFLLLLSVDVADFMLLIAAVILGVIGIAAAGTLIAALTISASVRGGLFPVLMLPVILPVFLPAIALTKGALTGAGDFSLAFAMLLYDAILALGASVLFDYLWYEE